MNIKRLLLTAAAAAVLSTAGAGMAMAGPHGGGGPGHHSGHGYHGGPGHHDSWRGHDRYWRHGYRHGYLGHDRIFWGLRRHHYTRFIGDPYWFNDRYVVRTYDRFGNVVIVEVDPYTGAFIGVIRF